jgi:histidyl-tRNA synthetase
VRNWLYNQIRSVSESFGYQEFEGPLLEPIELYAAKSGEELVKEQSFVFPDRSGDSITLRPELTPTLTRMVAQRQQQLAYPLRWWSFGPFWRYERPQKGRGREFFQWNIDLIGAQAPEADAEIAAVGASFLRRVGLKPEEVSVLVNSRELMDRELAALGIPPGTRPQVYRLIDRRDRMPPDQWGSFAAESGLSEAQVNGLTTLLENQELWQHSPELQRFFSAVEALGEGDYFRFDPKIIRGLDYYTGTVFEAWDCDGEFRAIFGGGRYDNLVADVGGEPLPAVGFAMGDMVVQLVLEKFGRIPQDLRLSTAPVLVTVFEEATTLDSYLLSSELRQEGLMVACYPVPDKLGKQLKYAGRIGARVAAILGPEEIQAGQVALKDLQSRDQVSVPRAEASTRIRQILDRP